MANDSKVKSKLREKFRDVTLDRLRSLNHGILELEKGNREDALINQIMREIHTLKGESRMMGFSEINLISHKIEDLLKALQTREFQFVSGETDLLFESLDSIAQLVQKKSEDEMPVDVHNLTGKLISFTEGKSAGEPSAPSPPRTEEPEGTKGTAFLFTGEEESIRVGIDKLDRLSETSGDLFINQIRYHNFPIVLRDIRDQFREFLDARKGKAIADELQQFLKMLNDILKDFQDETMKMDHTVSVLQEQVREVRLLPISTLFDLFPRTVRDLAKEFAKEINLNIQGGSIELDKMILDRMKDPMIHLIRNSIDHGIEPSEERVKLGKSAAGTILLNSRSEGDRIAIEVIDDGRGIDPQQIIQSAVKKRLLKQEEADSLSDRDALSLIFHPGFSTKEIITDLSGRGVGLDVVKENIEAMEGSVEVQSETGKGTKFVLRLPPSLNITKVLLLSLNGSLFAIPSSVVVEVIKISLSDIHTVEGQKVIHFRGWTVPVFNLREVLNLDTASGETIQGKLPAMIVELAQERIAFLADRIISEREIAVKPLGEFLGGVNNLAGATILEKGELAFLLHVPDLFESSRFRQRPTIEIKRPGEETTGAKAHILIVEDSLITREMEKSILLSYGYEVDESEDGLQALDRLREKHYDLIITDIEMPNMDGFELTRRIRSDENLCPIPIIIVSTRSSSEDRRQGVEAGADAYMVKSEFQHEKLIEIIKRLIR